MAQLVERSLPIPEVLGSNPVIGVNVKWTFTVNCFVKTKIRKGTGNGPFWNRLPIWLTRQRFVYFWKNVKSIITFAKSWNYNSSRFLIFVLPTFYLKHSKGEKMTLSLLHLTHFFSLLFCWLKTHSLLCQEAGAVTSHYHLTARIINLHTHILHSLATLLFQIVLPR